MSYPIITHIDQLLPSIEGFDNFIVVDKGDYKFIDYVFQDSTSFDDPLRAECRGIKFGADGKIIARPLHKFVNYGERGITYDWNKPHKITSKLDGTMIHPAFVGGNLVFMTRMGITEHAQRAFQLATPALIHWCSEMLAGGYTPIFEWTAPDNQIVVYYPESKLTLTQIRNTVTGTYVDVEPYRNLISTAVGFDVVDQYDFVLDDKSVPQLYELRDIEGFVVQWDNVFCKIKTSEYVQMHRAVSYFDREDFILPIVLDNQCDDLYPTLPVEKANRLREFESAVVHEYIGLVHKAEALVVENRDLTRKDFALTVANKVDPAPLKTALFKILDGVEPQVAVRDVILRNPEILDTRWKS